MKRKIYSGLVMLVIIVSVYYYTQNSYVELRPVIPNSYDRQIVLYHNQLFKFAKPNEIPANYYKNIGYVIKRSGVEHKVINGKIYVKCKEMNDMEMIWNYTTRSTKPSWFKLKRRMDSLNGDDYEKVIFYR